jgi:hypothetical protein
LAPPAASGASMAPRRRARVAQARTRMQQGQRGMGM